MKVVAGDRQPPIPTFANGGDLKVQLRCQVMQDIESSFQSSARIRSSAGRVKIPSTQASCR